MCRVRAAHGFPPHARRSFFERVHGLGILPVSLGPGAHMREAQGLEGAIDRIVRYREPELLMQPHDQIARPPADHAMDRSDRALLYDAGEKGLMNSVELGRHPRRRNIDETVRSLLVEPDHPVPQRLTIHATDRSRLFPRGPHTAGEVRRFQILEQNFAADRDAK